MYNYQIDTLDYFSRIIKIEPSLHTMGSSLYRYLEMKIHPLIDTHDFKQIIVRGKYDRTCGISSKEKDDKLFNFIRPTASIDNLASTLYINCFPGIDYVFHYGNIIKSYLSLMNRNISVSHLLPTEVECWNAITESELKYVPKPTTVIMGYVEGIQDISHDTVWHGSGNFLWKNVHLASGDGIILGCKHTYWGEIAGRIVSYLAMNGVKRIIYSGKLGTLNPSLIPNMTIATGDTSILPNGQTIKWNNLFENMTDPRVSHGVHITVPSVLQETTEWLNMTTNVADFVDPEIGHMAFAAYTYGIEFSYFHIISDNLSAKYEADLSNERKADVITNRQHLYNIIKDAILNMN